MWPNPKNINFDKLRPLKKHFNYSPINPTKQQSKEPRATVPYRF